MKKIIYHYSLSQLIHALIWSMFIVFAMVVLVSAWDFWVYKYEELSPTSRRFEYESIEPIKTWFIAWELLQFKSSVTRYKGVEVRQEDTLYCTDWKHTVKYPTQYRPINGTEWKEKGICTDIVRSYHYSMMDDSKLCRMCWTPTAITNNGFEKRWTYCTDRFKVNLPS